MSVGVVRQFFWGLTTNRGVFTQFGCQLREKSPRPHIKFSRGDPDCGEGVLSPERGAPAVQVRLGVGIHLGGFGKFFGFRVEGERCKVEGSRENDVTDRLWCCPRLAALVRARQIGS